MEAQRLTSPASRQAQDRVLSGDYCLCLLRQTLRKGSLLSLLGPIGEANATEWVEGFLKASELESQSAREFLSVDFEASPEWLSLQGPRSMAFASGAWDFRRSHLTESAALSSNSNHLTQSSPVVGLGAATFGAGGDSVNVSLPERQP